MKKMLKRTLAVMLSLAMLISAFAFMTSAVSVNESMSALRTQWSRGVGPQAGGRQVDYSYYSPKKGDSDKTKYPLCIFLAGAGEGGYEGEELKGNNFPYWSGEETQARFLNAGGSYLLIARSQDPIYWDTMPIESLKAAIDDFAQKNPNVDTNRIYVVGWCIGAVGATRLITEYPNSFAGAILHANRTTISASEAADLKNMAIWLVHCKSDSYSLYNLYCSPTWKNLKAQTANPAKIRLTTCDEAPDTGVLLDHVVWNYIAYDCRDDAGCVGLKTIDGYGNEATDVKAISWISQWSLNDSESGATEKCSCQCHSTSFFDKIIWGIKCFIYKLFGTDSKQVCDCGIKHW